MMAKPPQKETFNLNSVTANDDLVAEISELMQQIMEEDDPQNKAQLLDELKQKFETFTGAYDV